MINIKKIIEGDKEALCEFADLYYKNVVRTAKIYVGDACGDVAQDVWLKIIQKRSLLENVSNIENWLFIITRNACFNYLKLKRRESAVLTIFDEAEIESPQNDVLDAVITKIQRDRLQKIIAELPEIYSLPIIMNYWHGITVKEIAHTLDLPQSTVKWRIHAAKTLIKSEIIKRGFI